MRVMVEDMRRAADLPLWAKASIGILGFMLLLPFIVPVLSLMLLVAVPVIVGFSPWLRFKPLPGVADREQETQPLEHEQQAAPVHAHA